MNITIPPKPSNTVQSSEITITLDKEYKLLLKKFVNGETKYVAELISDVEIDHAIKVMIEATVVNYCNREGIW